MKAGTQNSGIGGMTRAQAISEFIDVGRRMASLERQLQHRADFPEVYIGNNQPKRIAQLNKELKTLNKKKTSLQKIITAYEEGRNR